MKSTDLNIHYRFPGEPELSEKEALGILEEVILQMRAAGESSIAERLRRVYDLLRDPSRNEYVR